jgi:hypothetical protein
MVLMLACSHVCGTAAQTAAQTLTTVDITGALPNGSPLAVLHMPSQLWAMLLDSASSKVRQGTGTPGMAALLAYPSTGSATTTSYDLYLIIPQPSCTSSTVTSNNTSNQRLLGTPPLVVALDESARAATATSASSPPPPTTALLVPLQCTYSASSTTSTNGLLCGQPATSPTGALLISQTEFMSLVASLAAASTSPSGTATTTLPTAAPGTTGLTLEESGQVVTVAVTPTQSQAGSGGAASEWVHVEVCQQAQTCCGTWGVLWCSFCAMPGIIMCMRLGASSTMTMDQVLLCRPALILRASYHLQHLDTWVSSHSTDLLHPLQVPQQPSYSWALLRTLPSFA